MAQIDKRAYAETFGPTVGDRVRLADTDLLIEVEQDYTLRAGSYGEEVKFGGGKTIRDGMAQSQRSRAEGAMDTVLTNALIVDHWGIVKADIGLKDGRVAIIGKAGQDLEELSDVFGVKTRRRLIQDVKDTREVGTDLGCQTNALAFSTR